MMIQPMVMKATPATTPASTTSTSGTSGASAASADSSPDNVTENDFLQLLVAQIQYQDPSNPTDSTTFVTQLAQFSQLEQTIAIRGDIENGTYQAPQNVSTATTNTSGTQGGN
jgi:flagellar basal-body rod modification protein FlgD